MKLRPRLSRKTLLLLGLAVVVAVPVFYLVSPEILVWLGTLLVSEVEAVPADAIVVLGGGVPSRAREAADLFRAGLASEVILTTQEPPDGYAEMRRMGIELTRAYENYERVLVGFGVAEDRITRIEDPVTETMDELERVRDFASERGWNRLVVVTSNYHTRRTGLIARYVFEKEWRVAVVGSRYDSFRPNDWWHEVRHVRTFMVELQKLIAYEVYLRPRLWF